MSDLPIEFPENLDDEIGYSKMKNSVFTLVDIMKKVGGFRFRHHDITKANTHRFYCSQDERFNKLQGKGLRDTPQMTRYKCNSLLSIWPSFDTGTIELTLKHHYHSPYTDKSVSPEVMKFIELHSDKSTPGDILKDVQTAKLPGSETLTINQIYYAINNRS